MAKFKETIGHWNIEDIIREHIDAIDFQTHKPPLSSAPDKLALTAFHVAQAILRYKHPVNRDTRHAALRQYLIDYVAAVFGYTETVYRNPHTGEEAPGWVTRLKADEEADEDVEEADANEAEANEAP